MRVLCIYFGDIAQGTLEGLAEACLRLTPQVAVAAHLPKKFLFLEIGACKNVYSEESILSRVTVLLKRFAVKARITIADDMPTALAQARFSVTSKESLPVEALPLYANPFGEARSLDVTVVLLKSLGVTTLKDFLRLPRRELAARFGKEALLALHYLEVASHQPWPYFSPKEKIIERAPVDDAYLIRELEPILFLLRGLLDRALLRLRGRGHLVQSLKISIAQEKYSTIEKPERSYVVELSFAVGSTLSLLSMVRDRLNFELAREPLVAAVTDVTVEILNSVPGQGRQTDFFSKKEEETEQFQAVVSRLIDRLGMNKAFMARAVESYRPEKSWQKTFDTDVSTSSTAPQVRLPLRPLRILQKPQALRRLENYFFLGQRKWLILELLGPERLSGEWWDKTSDATERDYFRVITDGGDRQHGGQHEELWVYQVVNSAQQTQYFLHGVFD